MKLLKVVRRVRAKTEIEAKAVRRRPKGSKCMSTGPRILMMFVLELFLFGAQGDL